MKQHRNILQILTESADLPAEAIHNVPLVELAGDNRVLIENHGGVCEYGGERIRVRLSYGQLCVCGSGMELARMNQEQLVISGRIDSVTLIRGRK